MRSLFHGRRRRRAEWLLGLAGLGLFAQKLAHDLPLGLGPNNLWLCHLGNLLMGAGLLAARWPLARVGALWLLPGVAVWLIDIAVTGRTTLPSVLSHLGGLALALQVSRRTPFRPTDALAAWLGFLLVQQACRWWTPAALNVNLAHAIYPGWERFFSGYFVYALVIALGTGAALAATCLGLRLWQRRRAQALLAGGFAGGVLS